jgi:hypothetical protein
MTRRDDGFERGRRRAVRKLERRLAKLDQRLARVRLTLIEAVDEMAILEGRLAAVRGDDELDDEEPDASEDDRAWLDDDTPEPRPAGEADTQPPPEPAPQPVGDAGAASSAIPGPAAAHETPWEQGVRELAERRSAEHEAVVPEAVVSEAVVSEAMERLLAGAAPVPSPSSAWPVIDPDRTW